MQKVRFYWKTGPWKPATLRRLPQKPEARFVRPPKRLQPLIDAELIDEVVGQLQSGKEAEVYLVLCDGVLRCAKVYKGVYDRTFKHKTKYTEGRKARNSRHARAMASKSSFGEKERDAAWQSYEVEALTQLEAAGVRVPKTFAYYEGVLLLELVHDDEGHPAPRLNDIQLSPEAARSCHQALVREAVLMLCAGLVHGDFSEFNVLMSHAGPVIIDLPQAVQATSSTAFAIFERDLTQLSAYLSRFAPDIWPNDYPKEIWSLFKAGKLRRDSVLTGKVPQSTARADITEVLDEISAAYDDEMYRRRDKK
jgi:RIO kinase 1